MLALFFALGGFLCAFCASCCVCHRSWPVWGCLETLRARFWRGSEGSGEGFGGPGALFFQVFQCMQACNTGQAREAFCIGKTNTKCMSAMQHTMLKTNKFRRWGLSNGAVHTDCAKNSSWGSPGSVFEGSGPLLDGSWAPLGRLWGALGRLWGSLGRFLGGSWTLLGISWLVWGAYRLDFGSP